MQTIIKKYFFK